MTDDPMSRLDNPVSTALAELCMADRNDRAAYAVKFGELKAIIATASTEDLVEAVQWWAERDPVLLADVIQVLATGPKIVADS